MKEVKYTIEYHNLMKKYILWKEVNSDKGFCVKGIYAGTKKECREKLKEIKDSK
jgi:hypothetical protein